MSTAGSAWGDAETQYFYQLSPEAILTAVERAGFICTGRVMALNSMENRVYEVEIELEGEEKPKKPSDRFRIAKFYRPGRWTKEQILEEHQFLADLVADEVPAVAPIVLNHGETVGVDPESKINFALFPKVGGRSPDELTDEQVERVGRLLARMHNVGAAKPATHRVTLTAETYGEGSLEHLLATGAIPPHVRTEYEKVARDIIAKTKQLYAGVKQHRIHGDCHLGNLLWNDQGPFWVDFDDMVIGPAVQDLWLMIRGRDEPAQHQLRLLVDAYDSMRPFNRNELKLIEPLRALRFMHFNAWISRRWKDPAFPRAFPQFGDEKYWSQQLYDLQEQNRLIAE